MKKFLLVLAAILISALLCGVSNVSSAYANTVVRLGVVGSLYNDLWAPAAEVLKAEGIDLEIVHFSDYVTPNSALDNGDIDLNAFQHMIYLSNEIAQHGYKLTDIGSTFIIPLNLYSYKVKDISEIRDGDIIAIPNDLTNGGRALKVLASAGLIKLKDSSSFSPSLDDIEEYNVKINISELAANTIPSVLPDVTAAVVNGNYALDFELKPEEAVFKDTSLNEREYWNLIAARTDDLADPAKVELFDKIVKAYQSAATKAVYDEQFKGYFIAVGWDEDLLAQFKK